MLAGRVVQSCTCSRVAGPKCVPPAPQRRSALVVRASASQPSPDVAEKQPEASSSALKSRQQRQQDMAQDRAAKQSDPSAPRRCKEAIDRGLALFGDKKYAEAVEMFTLALELPGNGYYRLPGSVREYSCPSDAEESAALYNMACAYAQQGQGASALTCIEAILENGFNDFKTLRTDPDLAPARGPAFDALVGRYDGIQGVLKRTVEGLKNRKQQVAPQDDNRLFRVW